MRYHDITCDDMKNGDGLRAVLWVSGCDHACRGCQNPVTWDPDDGLEFDEDAEDELMEILSRDYISGVTLSGGDPLFKGNRAEIAALCCRIKEKYPDKTIWIYTGYTFEQLLIQSDPPEYADEDIKTIFEHSDVLVDGPYIEEVRNVKKHWAGSDNQRVIDIPGSLKMGNVVLH